MNTIVIAKAIASIAYGIVGAIFITPVFIFLRKLFYGPFINKKLVEIAKAKGNVITARLIKHYDDYEYTNNGDYRPSGNEIGVYQYEYNNRKYKYRLISINRLPQEITLYYLNRPRKATLGGELYITQRSPWLRSFLVIGLICWLIGFIYLLNMSI